MDYFDFKKKVINLQEGPMGDNWMRSAAGRRTRSYSTRVPSGRHRVQGRRARTMPVRPHHLDGGLQCGNGRGHQSGSEHHELRAERQ